MEVDLPNLVLLGIQGSGKGTQAYLLKKNYGFDHLNIGSLLREEMKKKTDIGNDIKEYMLKGDLVPDKYIFSLVGPILHDNLKGVILDGFPRTLKQAEFLEKRMPVRCAIYFELDDKIAKERLSHRRVCQNCQQNYNLLLNDVKKDNKCSKCGNPLELRMDDNSEAINRRIAAFHDETKPVIEFFKDRDSLITIPATKKPEQIHQEIVYILGLAKPA